jgi:hypothetical protein
VIPVAPQLASEVHGLIGMAMGCRTVPGEAMSPTERGAKFEPVVGVVQTATRVTLNG